jgi:hypothetical protein
MTNDQVSICSFGGTTEIQDIIGRSPRSVSQRSQVAPAPLMQLTTLPASVAHRQNSESCADLGNPGADLVPSITGTSRW